MNAFREKLKKLFEFLLPSNIQCVFCGEEIDEQNEHNVCKHCANNLPYNNQKVCKICGTKIVDEATVCLFCQNKLPPYKIARSPFLYEYPISTAIAQLKFNNAKYLVKPLGLYLLEEFEKMNIKVDFVIPMPLSASRKKQRGYNQTELLSQVICKEYNVPMLTDIVERKHVSIPQMKLSWKQRQKNVEGIFTLKDKKKLKGKILLVIDDVMTTGATVNNLCLELNKGKPKTIYVLTLAHTDINRTKMIKNKNLFINIKLKYYEIKNKLILKMNKNNKF